MERVKCNYYEVKVESFKYIGGKMLSYGSINN
jgi:hypothetical protein